MGRSISENFKNRFGDRISVSYPNRQLDPGEQKIQNENLLKAFSQVLAGILKREPTQDELLGIEGLPIHKQRRKN
jgi:hypothetical protein